MWTEMSQGLREEVKRLRLVFTCDDCANFAAHLEQCSLRYPTAEHRKAHVEALRDGERVVFCKMFEAG